MGGNVFDDSTEFDHDQIDQLMDKINQVVKPIGAKLIPIERIATPKEVAIKIFFLSSEENTLIHGQVINISGGE